MVQFVCVCVWYLSFDGEKGTLFYNLCVHNNEVLVEREIAQVVSCVVYVKFFFFLICENVCSIKGERILLELLKFFACDKIAGKKSC
jgi:hypothetical protein